MLLDTGLLHKTLQENNYSLTKTRQVIFETLSTNDTVTMSELTKTVKDTVNRATVYRTIDLFEELGIVKRLQIGWKYKLELSENFGHHHHHLACLKCGMEKQFKESLSFLSSIVDVANQKGFTIEDHSLEIRGVCPSCQNLQ